MAKGARRSSSCGTCGPLGERTSLSVEDDEPPPPLLAVIEALETWSRAGAASLLRRCPACEAFFLHRSRWEKDFMLPGSTEVHVTRIAGPAGLREALSAHRPGAGRREAWAALVASLRRRQA